MNSPIEILIQIQKALSPNNIKNELSNLETDINSLSKLSEDEQLDFLKAFCSLTGFPNLPEVSSRIENEINKAILLTAQETKAKLLFAGYNDTCSVGLRTAFPGSDIDTLFFVFDIEENEKPLIIESFNKKLNPLLVSTIKERTDDVPDFITRTEFFNSLRLAEKIYTESLTSNNEIYASNLKEPIEDWVEAGKFNLDLAGQLDDSQKSPVLRAALVAEIARSGKILSIEFSDEDQLEIANSCLYKYSNIQQMDAMKQVPPKRKHRFREEASKKFVYLTTSEKMIIIQTMLLYSVQKLKNKISNNFENCFIDSGCGNMLDLINPLLSSDHRISKQ